MPGPIEDYNGVGGLAARPHFDDIESPVAQQVGGAPRETPGGRRVEHLNLDPRVARSRPLIS
jgi:hypothetical protein